MLKNATINQWESKKYVKLISSSSSSSNLMELRAGVLWSRCEYMAHADVNSLHSLEKSHINTFFFNMRIIVWPVQMMPIVYDTNDILLTEFYSFWSPLILLFCFGVFFFLVVFMFMFFSRTLAHDICMICYETM